MTSLLYGEVFVVFYLYIVSVHAVTCPTNENQPVNITRLTNLTFITWFKNTDDGTITNAYYNSTTGRCLRPSYDANYTIYCEEYDNNKYKYTLQVYQPIEGDVYYTSSNYDDKATIIFQDPVKIEPELKDDITLTDETQLNTSVTCTQLTPVFTWIIKFQNGNKTTIIGRTTTDTTGCDVNKTTVTSTATISNDTVKIINDPFTVSVQLSYRGCDNIYTSQPTPYFTIKGNYITTESSTAKSTGKDITNTPATCFCTCTNESDDATDDQDRFGVGVGVGVGISVVIAGVIVGVTMVILKIKGRTIAIPLTSTKDTGGNLGQKFTNMPSSAYIISGSTTSGVVETSTPSHYDDLNSETRENTAPTYQQLSRDVSGSTTSGVVESSSPSHYDDLNSETRGNTAPTYQQLSIYQN